MNQRCGLGLATLVFDSTTIYVVRRSELLQGSAVVSQFDGLVATPTSQGIYAPQGALNFDANPTHGYIIGVDNLLKGRLVLRRVNNPGAVPTLSPDVVITFNLDPTGNPIDVPHPGSSRPLDGLDHRLSQAVVRNGRLWTSHHFEVNQFGEMDIGGGRNGIRWYELANLATAPTLVQSGTVWHAVVSNPASYWNSSLMVNGQGHVALGMSTAGALREVGAAFTGRLAGDALEAMDEPTIYSTHQLLHLQPAGRSGAGAGVGPHLVDERRSRRRHDAVDAAAVRRRHRFVRTAAAADPGAAAGRRSSR